MPLCRHIMQINPNSTELHPTKGPQKCSMLDPYVVRALELMLSPHTCVFFIFPWWENIYAKEKRLAFLTN
jgi:hypothetical protein